MNPNDLKFVYMIILSVFALFFSGMTAYLTKKAIEEHDGDIGVHALLAGLAILAILVWIGRVAGIADIVR